MPGKNSWLLQIGDSMDLMPRLSIYSEISRHALIELEINWLFQMFALIISGLQVTTLHKASGKQVQASTQFSGLHRGQM